LANLDITSEIKEKKEQQPPEFAFDENIVYDIANDSLDNKKKRVLKKKVKMSIDGDTTPVAASFAGGVKKQMSEVKLTQVMPCLAISSTTATATSQPLVAAPLVSGCGLSVKSNLQMALGLTQPQSDDCLVSSSLPQVAKNVNVAVVATTTVVQNNSQDISPSISVPEFNNENNNKNPIPESATTTNPTPTITPVAPKDHQKTTNTNNNIGELLRICKSKLGLKREVIYSSRSSLNGLDKSEGGGGDDDLFGAAPKKSTNTETTAAKKIKIRNTHGRID
jgi:hypothetical protein